MHGEDLPGSLIKLLQARGPPVNDAKTVHENHRFLRQDDAWAASFCLYEWIRSCRTKMWKFQRAQKDTEEMKPFLCEHSRKSALECRFKRRHQVTNESPGSPSTSSRHVS